MSPDTVEDVVGYMEIAARVNVDMPESKDIDDAVIRAWAEYSVQNPAWLEKMGASGSALFANQGGIRSGRATPASKRISSRRPTECAASASISSRSCRAWSRRARST
jgi:hypothetical protein